MRSAPAFVLVLFLCGLAKAQTPAKLNDGVVSGTVVNSVAGEPIRKATLTLRISNVATAYSAISDASGGFRFEGLPAGVYVLSVSRPGFVYQNLFRDKRGSPYLLVGQGQDPKDLVVQMVPQGVIAGHVFDEDGDLLPAPGGAQVSLMVSIPATNGRRLEMVSSAGTDAEGYFLFAGLQSGRYYLAAVPTSRQNFLPSGNSVPQVTAIVPTYFPGVTEISRAVLIQITPGTEMRNVDLRLQKAPAVRVSGRVLNAPDGAYVSLSPAEGAGAFGIGNQSSDQLKDGKFTFHSVPPGNYVIRLIQAFFNTGQNRASSQPRFGEATITVGNTDIDDVEFTLVPGVSISGQIRAAPEASRAEVRSFALIAADGSSSTVEFTGHQSFRAVDLKPGDYSIAICCLKDSYLKSVRVGGQEVSTRTIDLRMGDPGLIELTVAPNAAKLAGVVRSADGIPAPAVSLRLWPASGGLPDSNLTDKSGAFVFEGLAPGDYYLAAAEDTRILMSDGFRAAFESQLTKVSVREGSRETVDLTFITSQEIEEAMAKVP